MTDKTVLELLNEAEDALNRSNTLNALRGIIATLRKLVEEGGDYVVRDTDLTQEIAHFDKKAERHAAEGDGKRAKLARRRSNMLKSASKLVDDAEGGGEDDA